MDLIDDSMDAGTLAARSIIESENVKLMNDFIDDDDIKSNKKDKKKKLKSDNQGNFSSYRNKSFVKNASRLPKGSQGFGTSDERTEENGEVSDEEGEEEEAEKEKEELRNNNFNLIKKKDKDKKKKKKKNDRLAALPESDSDSEDSH